MAKAYYTTKQGDRLDEVLHVHYGRDRPHIDKVLADNPHLRAYPLTLPMGLEIVLHDTVQREAATVNLWS